VMQFRKIASIGALVGALIAGPALAAEELE
jgi:hypothetical protein